MVTVWRIGNTLALATRHLLVLRIGTVCVTHWPLRWCNPEASMFPRTAKCEGCGSSYAMRDEDDRWCAESCRLDYEPRVGKCGCVEDEDACDECRANGWFPAEDDDAEEGANEKRAETGHALLTKMRELGTNDDRYFDEPDETVATDAIANILHALKPEEREAVLRMAAMHVATETGV